MKFEIVFDTGDAQKDLVNSLAIKELQENRLDINRSFTIDLNEEDLI